MKKTHDAAFVLIERAYGARPAFNYYVGGSQGGREGLTVAQRYPDDYDGVLATVPIVGLSALMLAPTLSRIQERTLSAWVPPTKGRALLAEFMRQCDGLDARIDGVINDYVDCRALFNVNDGGREPDPWARLRCPNDVDPSPQDASESACLTARQIETVSFVFSEYSAGVKLAHGRTTFGMWAPTTAVAGGAFGPPPAGRPPAAAPPPGAFAPGTAGAGGPPPGSTLGRARDRRRAEIARLTDSVGVCRAGGGWDVVDNALRGRWTMPCERGALRVAITLSPTVPPLVQFLEVAPARPAPAGAPPRRAICAL
jgi:hypothetical protein